MLTRLARCTNRDDCSLGNRRLVLRVLGMAALAGAAAAAAFVIQQPPHPATRARHAPMVVARGPTRPPAAAPAAAPAAPRTPQPGALLTRAAAPAPVTRLEQPDAALHAYAPQDLATTGAMGYGVGAAHLPFGHTLTFPPDDAAVVRAVAGARRGIGFVTPGPLGGVRQVPFDAAAQSALVRALAVYTLPAAKHSAGRFLGYLNTDDASRIEIAAGFAPKLPPAAAPPTAKAPPAKAKSAPQPARKPAATKAPPGKPAPQKPVTGAPQARKASAPAIPARIPPLVSPQQPPAKAVAVHTSAAPPTLAAARLAATPAAPLTGPAYARIVQLPAGAKITFGPLKDVRLPTMIPRQLVEPAHSDTTKPTEGTMQVDCAIDASGVPQDCRLLRATHSGDLSESIMSWLSSGAIRYPTTDAQGRTGGRRVLTVRFPGR